MVTWPPHVAAPYLGLKDTDALKTLEHDLKMMDALGKSVDTLATHPSHGYHRDHFHDLEDPRDPRKPIDYKADAPALRQLRTSHLTRIVAGKTHRRSRKLVKHTQTLSIRRTKRKHLLTRNVNRQYAVGIRYREHHILERTEVR